MKHSIIALALALCLLAPWRAAGQDTNPLEAQLARIATLRTERPGDGLLVFLTAMTQAQLGRREAALAELRTLRGRTLGLVPSEGAGFEALWDDAEFQALRRELMDAEQNTPQAPVAFRLNDPRLVPEGIAYDAARKRYFVGSIARHKIVAVDASGTAADFASEGLRDVLGLHVAGNRLYAVSTNAAAQAAQVDNAVMVYDLERNTLLARHEIDARQLNDVTSAPDGTVYCTDSAAGTLYRLRGGDESFAVFGEAGALRGANGVAVSPAGTVYVTLSTGIARVDPDSGAVERMTQPDEVATGGIDGLYWHEGALLGIQNWTNPGRVIRVELDAEGKRITALRTLQSHHHPEFAEPTTGVVVDATLMVIANSHIAAYTADPEFRKLEAFRPTSVLAVPAR